MEVVIQVPPSMDFNFDSACSSPYMTAPSSPQRLNNFYFSAPASPTRASSFYKELKDHPFSSSTFSTVPFKWEEKPGTPRAKPNKKVEEDNIGEEFEFEFSGQLERTSLSAEELFDKGKIRPLVPPPGYDFSSQSPSPRSPSSRKALNKYKDFDPFEAALEETRKRAIEEAPVRQARGREKEGSVREQKRGSRSLSPLRVSDIIFEPEESSRTTSSSNNNNNNSHKNIASTSSKQSYFGSIFSALTSPSKGYKKWKLKDLLLFRSASEGRSISRGSSSSATSRIGSGNRDNSLGKYMVLSKKEVLVEDLKNSSFRSVEGSVGGSSRRRPSFAEVHYTANRAVAEEMKRKTPMPYKQGLLGCLRFDNFDPAVHDLSRSIGSLTRGR